MYRMWLLTAGPFPHDRGGFLAGLGLHVISVSARPVLLAAAFTGELRTELVTWSPHRFSVVYTQMCVSVEPACCLHF